MVANSNSSSLSSDPRCPSQNLDVTQELRVTFSSGETAGSLESFEVAGGSVLGYEHRRIGKNNQDAYHIWHSDHLIIAVVCDGCGSSPQSEVGAQIGVKLVTEVILQQYQTQADPTTLNWSQIHQNLLDRLALIISTMGNHPIEMIQNYWLFTIVGAVIQPDSVTLFSAGDGVIIVNDQLIPLGPFPNNAPPYLAYSLCSTDLDQLFGFTLHQVIPRSQLRSLLLGTDGVQDLISAADRPLPGKSETVGTISQFWNDDQYFLNPDQIRRRLALINRDICTPDWQKQSLNRERGLLPDDTTLIVIRQR